VSHRVVVGLDGKPRPACAGGAVATHLETRRLLSFPSALHSCDCVYSRRADRASVRFLTPLPVSVAIHQRASAQQHDPEHEHEQELFSVSLSRGLLREASHHPRCRGTVRFDTVGGRFGVFKPLRASGPETAFRRSVQVSCRRAAPERQLHRRHCGRRLLALRPGDTSRTLWPPRRVLLCCRGILAFPSAPPSTAATLLMPQALELTGQYASSDPSSSRKCRRAYEQLKHAAR
jgi:hypothetical protein